MGECASSSGRLGNLEREKAWRCGWGKNVSKNCGSWTNLPWPCLDWNRAFMPHIILRDFSWNWFLVKLSWHAHELFCLDFWSDGRNSWRIVWSSLASWRRHSPLSRSMWLVCHERGVWKVVFTVLFGTRLFCSFFPFSFNLFFTSWAVCLFSLSHKAHKAHTHTPLISHLSIVQHKVAHWPTTIQFSAENKRYNTMSILVFLARPIIVSTIFFRLDMAMMMRMFNMRCACCFLFLW